MGIGLSPMELVIVGVVAILLFGQKLPDVMKSLGRSYRDFRSGLNDLQSQVNLTDLTSSSSSSYSSKPKKPARSYDDYDEPTAPKFEPPPSDAVSNNSAGITPESNSTVPGSATSSTST